MTTQATHIPTEPPVVDFIAYDRETPTGRGDWRITLQDNVNDDSAVILLTDEQARQLRDQLWHADPDGR